MNYKNLLEKPIGLCSANEISKVLLQRYEEANKTNSIQIEISSILPDGQPMKESTIAAYIKQPYIKKQHITPCRKAIVCNDCDRHIYYGDYEVDPEKAYEIDDKVLCESCFTKVARNTMKKFKERHEMNLESL